MPLSGDDCRRLIDAAQARAGQIGIRVTVAVVDEGGLLLALARMDGAPPVSAQIAEAKASGAALWHRDGASLAQVAQDRPAFFEAVGRMVRVPIIPDAGAAQRCGARCRGSERRQTGAGPGMRGGRAARDLINESRAARPRSAQRRSGRPPRYRRWAGPAPAAKSAANPCCSSNASPTAGPTRRRGTNTRSRCAPGGEAVERKGWRGYLCPAAAVAARCSIADLTPPGRCGTPARPSPISTPERVPHSVRSLNAPR